MTSSIRKPPAPEGFRNWLEYAILTFDGNTASLNFMFDDEPFDRDEIRAAVFEEFNALRAQVSLPPLDP